MKIKIRDNAKDLYLNREHYMNYNSEYRKMLERVQGMTLEVDTEYLFTDQFNTVPIPGVSENGMRLMEYLVEEVIDDERPGSLRCQYCGKWWHPDTGETPDVCPFCNKMGHIHRLGGEDAPQKKETRRPLFGELESAKTGSGNILLSPKYGVNPALDICPWCGESRGIALLGRLPDDAEAPRKIVTSIEPCENCRQLMDQGITLFETVDRNPENGIPQVLSDRYLTGRWMVVAEAFIDRTIDEPLKSKITEARFALMEDAVFEQLLAGSKTPVIP